MRDNSILRDYMTDSGIRLMHELRNELEKIEGSYFELLNGEYPIHILSEKPIRGIGHRDIVRAKVYVTISGHVEVVFDNNRLFFELPEDVARIFLKLGAKRGK